MKFKIAIAVLVLAVLGLGVALLQTRKKAEDQKQADSDSITALSTDLKETNKRLTEQQSINTVLRTNITLLTAEAEGLTNKLVATSNVLAKTEAEAKAAAEAAAAEIARREAKIKQLESTNDGLSKSMGELTNAIASLEGRIAETTRKLAQSEGDREFLIKELKRLQAEKAELERQFNDLAVLRDQVRKLKEELSVARRLEWIRKGLYGASEMKGASLLQKGFTQPSTNKPKPGLDVELHSDGPAKVNTPTNAAPAPK